MTEQDLINLLQKDLKNERKHLGFYTQAAVMLQGFHREELREFCEEEAKSELEHVTQFAQLIVYLGGIPGTEVNAYPSYFTNPKDILKYASDMEKEVADNYAERLRQTEDMENAATAYAHVFYEDQISDSWKNHRDLEQMLKGM